MSATKGTFIVIEGTDGSGKGTQFELLANRLAVAGYEVALFDFPQYDKPSSYFVREYLNGKYGTADEVGPYTGSLFYALDRFEVAPQIRQALADGKIVLANRFVGSSMAHQGTKFANPEERRGYFIWLDNLEFEMLRIPRPDVSFVLRVPAEVSQQLVDKKSKREYTNRKRDIHEADLGHLERAVQVYDDMCQLFPRDFVRLDCVRSGKLLDIETIQEMLWQKIDPILPPPSQIEMSTAKIAAAKIAPVPQMSAEAAEAVAAQATENNTSESEVLAKAEQDAQTRDNDLLDTTKALDPTVIIKEASDLLTQFLEQHQLIDDTPETIAFDQKDTEGHYRYYTPEYLPSEVKLQYIAVTDRIFDLYVHMVQALTAQLEKQAGKQSVMQHDDFVAQARTIAAAVLPAAAVAPATLSANQQKVAAVLPQMLGHELIEVQETAQKLMVQMREPALGTLSQTQATAIYHSTARQTVSKLADHYLSGYHAAQGRPVQLTDVWPRNEFELIPDMLYQRSTLPLQDIKQAVAGWTYIKKAEVFEAYIGQRLDAAYRPGSVLEAAHYHWDLVSDYSVFRELQRSAAFENVQCQQLTPRNGYEMPKIIELAGLTDQYESCFDLSLQLYSLLQGAGFELEAQYATLRGHRVRWQATCNARQIFGLYETRSSSETQTATNQLVETMYEKLAEVHPVLAATMRPASAKQQ